MRQATALPHGRRLLAASLCLPLGACSIFSPLPAWELLKATGSATSAAISYAPARASHTVHHGDAPVDRLCIEFNRDAQAPELVPALQAELKAQRVHSRVYEAGTAPHLCAHWLRYTVAIQWEQPPLGSSYKPFVSALSLSLHRANGELMSSSSYLLDAEFGLSKWASTRAKLAPVVKALLTGFES